MFGFKKSPMNKISKQKSVDSGTSTSSNPFDSDSKYDSKEAIKPARRTSSEPQLAPKFNTNPFDDEKGKGESSSSSTSYSVTYASRNKYKNDFRESGGLENQSVQELENYAAFKAEETTTTVNSCLKIAEDIREDASKTLVTLHHQGEQIRRTHMMAPDIDQDLSRGEKLLGSLGGMFSKTWKPKKGRAITGPEFTVDDTFNRKESHTEERNKLGLAPASKGRSSSRQHPSEPTTALQTVEVEKAKQDDALSDLSNILDELKVMAGDMGTEIERHGKALDRTSDDIDELNFRVNGANRRALRLLGK